MQDECQLTDFFCSGCSPDILCILQCFDFLWCSCNYMSAFHIPPRRVFCSASLQVWLAPLHPGRTSKLLNTETGRVIRAPRIGEKFNGFQYTQFTHSQVSMDDPTCDILFNDNSASYGIPVLLLPASRHVWCEVCSGHRGSIKSLCFSTDSFQLACYRRLECIACCRCCFW